MIGEPTLLTRLESEEFVRRVDRHATNGRSLQDAGPLGDASDAVAVNHPYLCRAFHVVHPECPPPREVTVMYHIGDPTEPVAIFAHYCGQPS